MSIQEFHPNSPWLEHLGIGSFKIDGKMMVLALEKCQKMQPWYII